MTDKSWDVNCALLSVRSSGGIPKLTIQFSMKFVLFVVSVVLEVSTALVSF